MTIDNIMTDFDQNAIECEWRTAVLILAARHANADVAGHSRQGERREPETENPFINTHSFS